MSKWLREPLIHFLLLGGLIFLVYNSVAGKGSAADEIFISKGQQENLLNTFSRTWKRPPTPGEFQGLLQDYIRQEIAYRESRNMGLDQDDIVIRRRLRQKLEMLVEDVAALVPPNDEQLQAYLDEHRTEYMLQPQFSLRQVYFSTDRRGQAAQQDVLTFLQNVSTDDGEDLWQDNGDPLPLPSTLRDMREDEIARLFGTVFTDGLQGLETGRWSGPVESGYGLHAVIVDERIAGRVPELVEVREEVQRDWMSRQRRESIDNLYDRLAQNYTIEVEPLADVEGSGQP
jgi:hypothetical protein